MDIEEVEATSRRAMTKARRERILAKTEGLCARCDEVAVEVDHIIPVWMGGADEDDNCEGLCVTHHKAKTRADAKARAKVKRLLRRRLGLVEPPKRPLRSRGFAKGTSRPFPKRADSWSR